MLFLGQLLVRIRVFGFLARLGEHISACYLRQSVVIDAEGKRVELGGAYHGGADLRHGIIGFTAAHLKNGLCLVVQLSANMTTGIVIALVEMQNRVDMYLELVRPFH